MNLFSLLNNSLADAAMLIIQNKDEIQEQTAIVTEIKLLLERESRFPISKTKTAGSVGKATTIIGSDVDVVFFIRGVQPPFKGVLDEFENILCNSSQMNFKYDVNVTRRTRHSIQFSVNNYDFDLLPAIDFIQANLAEPEDISQQKAALQKIKEHLHQDWSGYSSSLVFSTVNFMKKQSALAHEMARLAKFWYKSACITDYVYGAKYAMELIAVKACEVVDEKHHNENVHLVVFQHFLNLIEYFESLDIFFDEEYRLMNEHRPAQNRVKPSVLDPANPYNNLAKKFLAKPNVIKALKLHATRTSNNLREMKGKWNDVKSGMMEESDFKLYFINVVFKRDLFFAMDKVKILIGSRTQNEPKQCKPIEIRADVSNAVRKKIEFMQVSLTAICRNMSGNPQERIEKVFKMNYPGTNFVPALNERHENYTATLCLKIDEMGAALFSFDIPV